MSIRVRFLVAVLATVAAVTLGIAGIRLVNGAGGGALSALRATPAKARKAGTVSLELSISYTPPGGATKESTSRGVLDSKNRRAHMFVYPVLSQDRLEIVGDGRYLHLSIPEKKQSSFGDKRWIRVDVGSAEAAAGAALGPIPDPATFLAAMEGTVGPVSSPAMDGPPKGTVRTIGATISFDRMLKKTAPVQAHAIRGLGRPELPVEAALDAKGRLLRAGIISDLGERGIIAAVLDVVDYGSPVVIGVPPLDATVSAPTASAAFEMVTGT